MPTLAVIALLATAWAFSPVALEVHGFELIDRWPRGFYVFSALFAPFQDESDPGDPNAPELREHPNGSLGYVSDGIFIPMYGPPKKVKDVGHMTITNEENGGTGFGKSKARVKTVVMDNLLFSSECRMEDPDGLIFIQQAWPIDGEDMIVRALHPEALRGEGAMVRSNLSRVYVIDESLPRHAKRGYLAVEKIAMVEAFLGDFNLESRFRSFKDFETDDGNRAPSFVVEDTTTHLRPKGYYITARPSSKDSTRVICHLKERANGPAKNALRSLFPPNGPKKLTHWVMAEFPGAQTLLFD